MNTVGCLILYSKNIEGNNQYIACIYWCLNKRFDDGAFTITRSTRHSFLSVEHLYTHITLLANLFTTAILIIRPSLPKSMF